MMKRYDCTLDIERDYYVTDERTAIETLQKQGVFVYLDEFGNVYNREKEYCLRIKEGKKESPPPPPEPTKATAYCIWSWEEAVERLELTPKQEQLIYQKFLEPGQPYLYADLKTKVILDFNNGMVCKFEGVKENV